MKKKVYKLYSSCQVVKGYKRSLISDLHRNRIQLIPNDLGDILIDHPYKNLEEIQNMYDNKYHHIIKDYFKFLIDNDYIFITDEPERFTELQEIFKYPAFITNAVLDIDKYSSHSYDLIAEKLNDVGCETIDIRLFEPVKKKTILKKILQSFEQSRLRSIRLIIPFSMGFTLDELGKLCEANGRIQTIFIHSADKNINTPFEYSNTSINYRKQVVNSPYSCGFVGEELMISNIQAFMESKKYNSCLNKKLSIDRDGNIKNCSQMTSAYGNINSANLLNIVRSPSFKELWGINKDQIKVCKDCEFRYNCIDCRALLEDEQDIFSKPMRCNYDPYTATWM